MGGQPNPPERRANSNGPTTDASDVSGFSRRDFLHATGGTFALAGDAGSGEEYTAELIVTDRRGTTTSGTASATAGESGQPPAVDSLTLSEVESGSLSSLGDLSLSAVETESGDAELEADWAVSDPDGDLSEVGLALTDDSDGTEEDTATVSVSGTSASDTTRLVAAGDDGSGHTYTVELSVTDSAGRSAADTATATIVDGDCVVEHFTGEDGDVGDIELLRAIRFWREDRDVPGCEQKVDYTDLLDLIAIWRGN
ncbi:MAG: hypothetical protein ABEH61_02510 [Haloarculaceae archaeon]